MLEAGQYGERGGDTHHEYPTITPTDTFTSRNGDIQYNSKPSNSSSITEHDFRFPRRPAQTQQQQVQGSFFSAESQFAFGGASQDPKDKLDFTGVEGAARKDLLRETFFPTLRDDTAGAEELDSPDEMQKKDPLATQIWRLYSKTMKHLPNQERMENLTWRMMAMNLRKRRQEDAARYVRIANLWYMEEKSN